MSGSTIRVYDPVAKTVTEIPRAELAPGYIRCNHPRAGDVFMLASGIRRGGSFRHPPFSAELKKRMQVFARTFREVYPCTPRQWENRFRTDVHMGHEMDIWWLITIAYRYLTRKRSYGLQAKRDVFHIILSCVNNGLQTALECIQCDELTQAQAVEIRDEFRRLCKRLATRDAQP